VFVTPQLGWQTGQLSNGAVQTPMLVQVAAFPEVQSSPTVQSTPQPQFVSVTLAHWPLQQILSPLGPQPEPAGT
jgi:hypothetical protein